MENRALRSTPQPGLVDVIKTNTPKKSKKEKGPLPFVGINQQKRDAKPTHVRSARTPKAN